MHKSKKTTSFHYTVDSRYLKINKTGLYKYRFLSL